MTQTDSKNTTTTTPKAEAVAPKAAPAAAVQQQAKVEIDDSKAISTYANFCRVTGTPEELIVDFGLNPQPMGAATSPIFVDQRVVMNYFTAKRLLNALHMSVQRHESVFGVLETDVQKRVQVRPAAKDKPAADQKKK